MKELVEVIAKSLVEKPEEVVTTETETDDAIVVRNSIGRQGYNHVQYEDRVPLQLLVCL